MKTLNDILKHHEALAPSLHTWVEFDELKKEARKWVKELKEKINPDNRDCKVDHLLSQIDWIEHFFNLEDEK